MLEELKLPYETKIWDMQKLKTPEFEKVNPNGRVPAIEDPNTGIVLWEVCSSALFHAGDGLLIVCTVWCHSRVSRGDL